MQPDEGNKPGKMSCLECLGSTEPLLHIKWGSLSKLKDSTRKLLCLIEEIESKTHSNSLLSGNSCQSTEIMKPMPSCNNADVSSAGNILGASAIRRLEKCTKDLNAIHIEDEDDCSVYKRLTRKCHCMNHPEYNDFIIHFNEDTKYLTSIIGEIIKNLRILKKFLYMGGEYTKHALMFLNEGMSDSTHTERLEVTQGIAHSDICNVFEDHSIVVVCILWPCKYEYYGDTHTQRLAANFLLQLAQLEEGRRYLKFTSKITNDLKKLIRKRANKLEFDTLEHLNATLNLMHPPKGNTNVTYYCKHGGYGSKTVTALFHYREMTLDQVFTHLDLIYKLSSSEHGKMELTSLIPNLLSLFKQLLKDHDNSEMNIIVTNVLNNIISQNMVEKKEHNVFVADAATEPIKIRNEDEACQMPAKKATIRHCNKSKLKFGKTKCKHPHKKEWMSASLLNRSKKFTEESRKSIIIVPIEENT